MAKILDQYGKVLWEDKKLANLHGANLRGANLHGANLREADLRGANLHGANLRWANLRWADLRWADLRWADLHGADLHGANLRWADLHGANLREADLRGANLHGANLRWVEGVSKYLTTSLYGMLDQAGRIRAYKLVTAGGEGPQYGGITYAIGGEYRVNDADTDEQVDCGRGINLATLDWCLREWRKGQRVLVAEFTVEDIAAIPIGSDGKFRVHRCKIVAEKDLVEIGWPVSTKEVEDD